MGEHAEEKKIDLLFVGSQGEEGGISEKMSSKRGDVSFKIVRRSSVSSALSYCRENTVDAVLLSLPSKGIDGAADVQRISKKLPHAPVVVLTDIEDREFAVTAAQAGAEDFLVKSRLDNDLLVYAISSAIERKHSKELLRASESLLRTIIENNADGLLIINKKGIVVFANPAAVSMFKMGRKAVVGKPFQYPVKAGKTREIDIPGKNGAAITVEMRVVYTDWEGERALLASLRDISEHKNLEESLKVSTKELNRVIEELEQANKKILDQQKSVIEEERLKVLLQMAGATAHEINQPLTVLLGNIELMKTGGTIPSELSGYLSEVEDAARKISGIVSKVQNIPHYDTRPYAGDVSIINFDHDVNVLSIEDEDDDYETIASCLKNVDRIRLHRVTGMARAVKYLKHVTPDVVLLDYSLPDGNGIDFLRMMNRDDRDIPVIVITGQGDETIASRAIQEGAFDYFAKDNLNSKSLSRSIANTMEKARLKREIRQAQKRLAEMATKDELTGLYNRRYFMEALERETAKALRTKTNFTLFIFDLDLFKQINDTYGHPAGDRVLAGVAGLLHHCIRTGDLACRIGGEEFAVILHNAQLKEAGIVCERFRKMVWDHEFIIPAGNDGERKQSLHVTVSIGIALFDGNSIQKASQLISASDTALYRAKKGGRNRVEVALV